MQEDPPLAGRSERPLDGSPPAQTRLCDANAALTLCDENVWKVQKEIKAVLTGASVELINSLNSCSCGLDPSVGFHSESYLASAGKPQAERGSCREGAP